MGAAVHIPERDLEPVLDERRWSEATSAHDDPIVTLVGRARANGDALVDRVVDRIVATIPAYADTGPIAREDLHLSVSRNLDLNLLVLAERRDLYPDELAARASLGVRRAQAGMPISDLLRAFRVGYVVLWEELAGLARELGRDVVDRLLFEAGRIWELLDRISSAVADAYRETLTQQDVNARRRALALVAGIETYPEDRDATESHARALGLDPSGAFIVAVCCGHASISGPGLVCAEQPDQTVLVFQPTATSRYGEHAVVRRLLDAGFTSVGVGLVAPGLAGARRSLDEAERAHRAALETGAPSVAFRDGWFRCLATESAASLESLSGELVTEVRQSPEVRETLAAVLEANGNLTAAARNLHLHANTVSYRLQRLEEVTGFDVRAPGAVLQAHLALALADRTGPP